MTRLRTAAVVAFCAHLFAGLGMAFVLRYGLETTPDLQSRFAFLVSHRVLWTMVWLAWTASAMAILNFYIKFDEVHETSRFAVLLTVAALGPDLAAQAIEIGVLPALANEASNTNGVLLFLSFHRAAMMLTGYLANGLYSISTLILVSAARRAYPVWVSVVGSAVGLSGIGLSVAALLDSVSGMFWTNVLLVPSILIWLGAVAIMPPKSGWRSNR